MGVTAAIGLTLISANEQKKREKETRAAQERAAAVERAERASQATRERRKQVRQARIRRAEVQNQAAVGGQTGSSAAVAAQGSLTTQMGTNIGSIGTALATGEAKSIAEQNIFEANRKSNLEIFSGAGLNLIGMAGGGK